MSGERLALGKWGESLAADYLADRGYIILERNARTSYGEIDLVARQGSCLVFVEVKTRASAVLGSPEISVSGRKQAHLIASARAYVQALPEQEDDWRIDVIAIRRFTGVPAEIVHFENVISD